MQFIETVSFGSRLAGKLTNRLSLGTTLQHSFFVSSRLFLPPLLLILSFLIESNLDIKTFLLMASSLTLAAFFASLIVFQNFNSFQIFFQRLFEQYETSTIPVSLFKVLFSKKPKLKYINIDYIPKIRTLSFMKCAVSCFAYFFLSTGFLFSFSLAILNPDYRMTMSQLTTAFHGIGAIVLALFIDPMLCRSLDVVMKNSDWMENIYSIFVGRLMAYLLSSILFIVFYLYV